MSQWIKTWFAWKRERLRWWWSCPFMGDPRWGPAGSALKRKNLDIAFERWEAREPLCENYLGHKWADEEGRCKRCGHLP